MGSIEKTFAPLPAERPGDGEWVISYDYIFRGKKLHAVLRPILRRAEAESCKKNLENNSAVSNIELSSTAKKS